MKFLLIIYTQALLSRVSEQISTSSANYRRIGLFTSYFCFGGGSASGAEISLDAALGQPITGISGGGSTTLQAGFFTSGTEIEIGSPVYLPLVSR